MFLLDTNIAIDIRDKALPTLLRLKEREVVPHFSIVTRVELEGGVDRVPALATIRRNRLQEMIDGFEWVPFDDLAAAEYGRIISKTGFSRTRVLDRMIAAQAIVAGATLITMNGPDFADIPDLELEIWPTAAQ